MKKIMLMLMLCCVAMFAISGQASAAAMIEKADYTLRQGDNNATMNVMITLDGKITDVAACIVGETESQLRVLMKGARVGGYEKGRLDGKYAKAVSFQKADGDYAEAIINFDKAMRVAECRTEIRPQTGGKSLVILTIRLIAGGEQARGIKGKMIVIDAGHGGGDCGAIGASGIYEKDVTLAIAKQLQKQLMMEGAKTMMTRTTDREVSRKKDVSDSAELGARVTVAERAQADIFISIHLNSFASPDVGGVETYYYQGSFAGERLANRVQKSLMEQFSLQDRGVKTANFYVLKHSSMPTILTELAFISNPREEKLLIDENAQVQFARAILNGVKQYFSE